MSPSVKTFFAKLGVVILIFNFETNMVERENWSL